MEPDRSASPRTLDELAVLDDAVRTCSSIEEFAAASALYPGVLGTIDPLEFLLARCHHPASELGNYATCASLERALATPTPAPTATATPHSDSGEKKGSEGRPEPKPRKKPEPTPRPTAKPAVPQATKPRIRMTAVPSSYRAPVPAASRVHYFAVTGKTPRQLTRSMTRQARNYCGPHASACLETRGARGVRPTYVQNPFNGSCTITGVKMPLTYVAHMPRWTAPSRVPSYMVWWWRKAAARIGWHEAQHARIAKEYAARLPKMVVGKPCARYGRVLNKWSRSLNHAQQAFDRLDYPRTDTVLSRWWRQAYDRYLY